MNGRGITAAEVNAGQCLDPYRQIELLRAEVAALRQRAEAAERLADVRADALLRTLARAEKAESDLAAERVRAEAAERERDDALRRYATACANLSAEGDLKRAAYAKLDSVRTVVEETIIPALEAWPGVTDACRCHESPQKCVRCEARSMLTDALAAARKTLED